MTVWSDASRTRRTSRWYPSTPTIKRFLKVRLLQEYRFHTPGRMSGKGQVERLPPPRLSVRYVIRQETSAGAHGKGRNAPTAATPRERLDRFSSSATLRQVRGPMPETERTSLCTEDYWRKAATTSRAVPTPSPGHRIG